MNDDLQRVTVRLLDKEYQVACPEDEREALLESAELLNRKMKEIRDSGKVVGVDRIAVLEMGHQVFTYKPQPTWWGGSHPEPAVDTPAWREACGPTIPPSGCGAFRSGRSSGSRALGRRSACRLQEQSHC